ncbi:HLA class II histocompatibility antigen, DP beta 1 chain-like [Pyxicephalus adspersus]|uniref:HLA class II histocompatibility antigen, DP beta 1 chain-like n=1 Tax=Pyxicephalus adspersus TaxID=30357 RepID=UPI003B5C72FA
MYKAAMVFPGTVMFSLVMMISISRISSDAPEHPAEQQNVTRLHNPLPVGSVSDQTVGIDDGDTPAASRTKENKKRPYWKKIFEDNLNLLNLSNIQSNISPQMKISTSTLDEMILLDCDVSGSYSQLVNVKWMKNDIEEVPIKKVTQVLSNSDGTYQITVTVEIIPKEGDNYTCHLDHRGLGKSLVETWTSESSFGKNNAIKQPTLNVIYFVTLMIGIFLVIIFVAFLTKRCKSKESSFDIDLQGKYFNLSIWHAWVFRDTFCVCCKHSQVHDCLYMSEQ